MSQKLVQLRNYLARMNTGPITEVSKIESLLAACWDDLGISRDGGMEGYKLYDRMEDVNWNPPLLAFQIEQHGGTVQGSSRAELQQWTIDVVTGIASFAESGFRQTRPMAARVDVNPIAEGIAALIVKGQEDERLKWFEDGRVRVEIGKVISEWTAAKRTIQGRRRHFREELEELLSRHGWVPTRGANTYVHEN